MNLEDIWLFQRVYREAVVVNLFSEPIGILQSSHLFDWSGERGMRLPCMHSRCRRHGVYSLYPNSSSVVSTPEPKQERAGGDRQHFHSVLLPNSNLTRRRRVLDHATVKGRLLTVTKTDLSRMWGKLGTPALSLACPHWKLLRLRSDQRPDNLCPPYLVGSISGGIRRYSDLPVMKRCG